MTEEHKEKLAEARRRAKEIKAQQSPVNTNSPTSGGNMSPVQTEESSELMGVLKELSTAVAGINKRLTKIETGGVNEFMEAAKPEDIASAGLTRKNVDSRIIDIVNRILGEDFGIELGTFKDRPGFLFTLLVPHRLSDNQPDERPVRDPETGNYKMRADGQGIMTETYFPEDRRSRALSSEQSFDAVKEHCERVRSYIVAYYTKMSKPLPEFKLK